ncbi:MAG: alpha/beta fold hydrolase, partial [Pseudomonadota bacterium]
MNPSIFTLFAATLFFLAPAARAQTSADTPPVDPEGLGIAGLWFDPTLDGEGFSVVQSDAGITVYFYGYDSTGQALWLISDTFPSAASPDTAVTLTAYRGTGGNFSGPVQEATFAAWGDMTMTVQDCDNVRFELSGADGSKSSATARLAGITGNYCSVRGETRSGATYCEILLGYQTDEGLLAEVWGTQFVGECTAESFAALDQDAIQAEYNAAFIKMNGPRQVLPDSGRFDSTGDVLRTFGDLTMAQQATLLVSPEQASSAGPYIENTVLRENVFELWSGSEVYELTSDEGKRYVMFSIAQTVDPEQTIDQLSGLGSRLELPAGWSFSARTLERDLVIDTRGRATVLQDSLENSYQLVKDDDAFGLAGLWYEPSRDGEGFNVIESDAGTTVYYYGYDAAGEPLWLVTETLPESLGAGDARVLQAFRGTGGTFEEPLPGAELNAWGRVIVVASECGQVRFELDGADGSKATEVTRLAGITGNACAEPEILETSAGIKFVRTPDDAFDNLPDWPYEGKYVEIDGLRQAYAEAGPADGEVVLLLHGQPSWSYLYRKMIPVLADGGYRVIAMDHLGLGRSDKPIDVETYTYLGHSDRLERFIQALELTDINLFVQDWGSLIGLRVAGLNPEWFASIAVGNGTLPDIPEGFEPFPPVENTDQVLDLPSPYAQFPDQQVPFFDGCELLFEQPEENFFPSWMNYAMNGISFRASDTLESLTWFELSAAEEAAYDAPFPSRLYMGGIRTFPSLINDVPGTTQEALTGLTSFARPLITIWAANDPGNLGSCETQQWFIDNVPGAEG